MKYLVHQAMQRYVDLARYAELIVVMPIQKKEGVEPATIEKAVTYRSSLSVTYRL